MRVDPATDDKRITLRLSADLYRDLRVEAAKRDMSTTRLINQILAKAMGREDVEQEGAE